MMFKHTVNDVGNVGRNFYQIINMKTERFPSKILIWPIIGLFIGIIMCFFVYYIDKNALYNKELFFFDIVINLNSPAGYFALSLPWVREASDFFWFYFTIIFQWVFIGSLIALYIWFRKYRRERKDN